MFLPDRRRLLSSTRPFVRVTYSTELLKTT